MEKYEVIINPKAYRELKNIYRYISIELLEPSVAKKQTDSIMDEIEKLETFPYSHQDRMFGRYSGKGYKQLLIGHYIVIYKIDSENKVVIVITVQYVGRNM